MLFQFQLFFWQAQIPGRELGPARGGFPSGPGAGGVTARASAPIPVRPPFFGIAAPPATNISGLEFDEEQRPAAPPAGGQLRLYNEPPTRVPGGILGAIGRFIFGPLGGLLGNLNISIGGGEATAGVPTEQLFGIPPGTTPQTDPNTPPGGGSPFLRGVTPPESYLYRGAAPPAAEEEQTTAETEIDQIQMPADASVAGDEEGSYNPGGPAGGLTPI